ncbi:MAG: hypothetical protein M0R21_10815 [Lentimicrobiaceae bacterium]|jgi:hypothetical protein|nr:hypothetical protein [Lentimicrobiaceae bacterium]
MFKKDNFLFGLLASFILTGITFALLFAIWKYLLPASALFTLIKKEALLLMSAIPSILLLRYFITQKLMKTAKGILLFLFAGVLVLFILIKMKVLI